MLFIRPAIRSAGRRLERLRCRTERKSRSMAPWIAAATAGRASARATGGARRSGRSRARAARARSRRPRRAARSGRRRRSAGARPAGSSRAPATGVSFSRSQTERTSLRRRPSISRCTSSSSSSTAARSLRAALEPPEISGPVVRSSRNSTITASSTSWLILPRPLMARAKRSMSGSASSRRKPAASSGPMAVRIIAAFSIGRRHLLGAQRRQARLLGLGLGGDERGGSRSWRRSSGPWRRRAGSSRRR